VASSEFHDEFLDLCALATTELLSADERHRLHEHVSDCDSCRDVLAQYQALVDAGIPEASLDLGREHHSGSRPGWSLDEAERSLLACLDREDAHAGAASGGHKPSHPASRLAEPPNQFEPAASADALWRQMWWQYAAGVILVIALGYSVYRTGIHRGKEMAEVASPTTRLMPRDGAGNSADPKGKSLDRAPNQAESAQMSAIRAQLENRIAEIARLEAQKTALEQNLRAAESGRDQMQQNAEDLVRQLAASQADLESAKLRLEAAGNQNSRSSVALVALQRQIDELRGSLAQRDQEIARELELLDHDQDIRELMGSRNLYIAEVYDVAKTGNTQRPFGRVFYTQGKSLVFYAYDLDQQLGIRDAITFQAWGRRGPDETRAVNLGMLYLDNAVKKRWILKADDPKTLADIDAVFVTVEPHGGSSHPSGKPLLFAYLRIEPNHP
jgi:hypothetical protein